MKAYIVTKSFQNNPEVMIKLKTIADEIVVNSSKERPNEAQIIDLVKEYDILVIGVKEQMTKKIYDNASKLKYLCTLSIGLDHINKAFFEDKSKTVVSCYNSNVITVAEFAFGYILTDIKNYTAAHEAFINGKGREGLANFPTEISSKTIGVIGARQNSN